MDEKFLELKFMEAITEANFHLMRSVLGNFVELATGKKFEDFQNLSEEEQTKLLDGTITIGKVYQMISLIMTQALNKKIEIDSASKAYVTETEGKKNGSK